MAGDAFDRRNFLRKAGAIGAAGAAALSFEEQILQAHQERGAQDPPPGTRFGGRGQQPVTPDVPGPVPTGKLGKLTITRIIAGHNLVGWQAHSRDLIYTSQLLRAYFTDDKVLETYQKYEENGMNTSLLRIEARAMMLCKKYMKERGGKLQWIAQLVVNENDQTSDIEKAVECGAVAGYVRGLEGDSLFKKKRMDVIGKALENIRKAGLVAGLATHSLDPMIEAEKMGLNPDFYMKTFNSAKYWSAGKAVPPDPNWKPTPEQLVQSEYEASTHDNIWETTPVATAEFFKKVKKPFVAYKVLAAGAIHPRDGFKYAFDNGADFVVPGMYDFQVKDDVNLTKATVAAAASRARPWA
jgi:hypothetical protein